MKLKEKRETWMEMVLGTPKVEHPLHDCSFISDCPSYHSSSG